VAQKKYHLAVPNAEIVFDPTLTSATSITTVDATNNIWITKVLTTGLSGNVFAAGLAFKIPSGNCDGPTAELSRILQHTRFRVRSDRARQSRVPSRAHPPTHASSGSVLGSGTTVALC
jgi:hypothetical protein